MKIIIIIIVVSLLTRVFVGFTGQCRFANAQYQASLDVCA
jgi:hypothetical protein